jgi:hypothetical protein
VQALKIILKQEFIMESDSSNCVVSRQQEDLNIGSEEEIPRMCMYFQEPQGRDHDLSVSVEPDCTSQVSATVSIFIFTDWIKIKHSNIYCHTKQKLHGFYPVQFEVVTGEIMRIAVLWDVTPCSLVDHYRWFGGMPPSSE